MDAKDLQLGDVVELETGGQATVIAIDPTDSRRPIMVGWNGDECHSQKIRDIYDIRNATFLPNAKDFEWSWWPLATTIIGKISFLPQELPCRQCGKNNDTTAIKCWWCETEQPTKK